MARRLPLRLTPPKPPRVPEKAVQAHIIAALSHVGYRCLKVGQGRKGVTCPKCRAWFHPTGYVGNDPGVPDLFCYRDGWPVGVFVGLEVKAADTEVRPAQEALAQAGRVFIVRSPRQALRAAYFVEADAAMDEAGEQRNRINRYCEMNEGRLE